MTTEVSKANADQAKLMSESVGLDIDALLDSLIDEYDRKL